MSEKISAEILKKSISYYYLLSYCPPELLEKFKQSTAKFLESLFHESKMEQEEFLSLIVPRVSQRIVGFHQNSHQPDPEMAATLSTSADKALGSEKDLQIFQNEMILASELDPRAKAGNRLHRRKGCEFCITPCRYGYFTLVSEPRFDLLQEMFQEESSKPPSQQSASNLVWKYTEKHLNQFHQSKSLPIMPVHFGNLAFCLLMLSMAKSRKTIPVEQIKTFQTLNQEKIVNRS